MANEIMVRKASKDYVCSCCGHIIRKGDEYLDKVILNVGKIVKHDRYHDECPVSSTVIKLINKIEHNNGDLICSLDGYKIHVIGIVFKKDGPYIMFRDWVGNTVKGTPIEFGKQMRDDNGNSII